MRRRSAEWSRSAHRPRLRCPSVGRCRRTACGNSLVEGSRRADAGENMFAIPFAERLNRTAIVAGTFDTKGRELNFIRDRLKALGICHAHGRPVDVGQALNRQCHATASGEHASTRHRGGLLRRSRTLGRGDGRSVRALDRTRAAGRWHHRRRRFGRHDACDCRHAGAAGRHPQGHGLHRRLRRRAHLCRRQRRRHVSLSRRRPGPQLDHGAGTRQRRARTRRHDRANADARSLRGQAQAGAAGARYHDVRRHHAVRSGAHQAARS